MSGTGSRVSKTATVWAAAAIALAGTVLPARGVVVGRGTLADPAGVVLWTGHFEQPTLDCYAEAAPEVLVLGREAIPLDRCTEFRLTIDLPAGTWDEPGGVQIGIHWPYDPEARNIDFAVFGPNGALAGSSIGSDEDTESLLLREPRNGTYRILVGALFADGVTYSGRAEVEYLPPADPLRDLLPNLYVLPQRNLVLGATGLAPFQTLLVNGCLPEEILEQGARRCLRFEQVIANSGDGPMELRYTGEDLTGDRAMYQRVHRSDGTVEEHEVSSYEIHLAHGHVHYTGFALSRLWASDSSGAKIGEEPVREGRKNGFCLIDVQIIDPAARGDAARTYYGDGCADVGALALGEEGLFGISVGWADTYNWFLADQYIEVSGVEDGLYLLETVADPNGTVDELDEADNAHEVLIRICGSKAEIVGTEPPSC